MDRNMPLINNYTAIIIDGESIPFSLFENCNSNHQGKTMLLNKFRSFAIGRQMPLSYAVALLGNLVLAVNFEHHNFEYDHEDHCFHCTLYSLSSTEWDKPIYEAILEPINLTTLYLRLISK